MSLRFSRPLVVLLLALCQLATQSSAQVAECFPSDGNSVLRQAVLDYQQGANSEVGRAVRARYGEHIENWCVDRVASFQSIFSNQGTFNANLTFWNTSSAFNMDGMFFFAFQFNGLLSSFVTSRVENMRIMFQDCSNFNQPVAHFDVSRVVFFTGMFRGCNRFNQPVPWDTVSGRRFVSIRCDDGTR